MKARQSKLAKKLFNKNGREIIRQVIMNNHNDSFLITVAEKEYQVKQL